MFKRVLKNKKGFTLIELIAVITLMAIIAGIAVPSIYFTTARKQRSSAENDTQQMYRNAISCISDLAAMRKTPEKPWGSNSTYLAADAREEAASSSDWIWILNNDTYSGGVYTAAGTYYIGFAEALVTQMYKTIVALDIDLYYYNPKKTYVASNPKSQLVIPDGCAASDRGTYISAGNKNPYIVIQIKKIINEEDETYYNQMIISYHNEKNRFKLNSDGSFYIQSSEKYGIYQTNGDRNITYSFRIRSI